MIKVLADVKDADKRIGELKKTIKKMEDDLDRKNAGRNGLEQELIEASRAVDETSKKVQRLRSELEDIRNITDYSKGSFGEVDPETYINALSREREITKELKEQEKILSDQEKQLGKVETKYQAADEDVARLTTNLDILKDEAGELQSKINSGNAALKEFADTAEVSDKSVVDLRRELERLEQEQKSLEEIGLGFGYEQYDKNAARIAEIDNDLKEYKKNLLEIPQKDPFEDLSKDAEVADQRIVDLNRELQQLKQRQKELDGQGIGLGHQEYDQNAARIADITRELKEYKKSLSDAGDAAPEQSSRASVAAEKFAALSPKLAVATEAAGKAKDAFDKLKAAASRSAQAIGKAFSGALKTLRKFSSALLSTAKRFIALVARLNVFSKLSDGLSRKFKRLGSTIKSALVFSVIYKGLSLVREQVGKYLSVNTQFMTALRRLQGVLLTAFQPIYEIVVPALTTLINILSRAIATVTQFFASLFGKTAKQAQINAKDLYEQANATEAVGNAAEEASLQMAAFDEINKLDGNRSAGGGGGGAASETGPLFDFEYEDTPFDSWGASFSAFLDKLLDGIPQLRNVLKKFADWLNDLARKLYDMFTFPGVLDKVKQLGRELAEALNQLVNDIDWYLLGQALGAGLNLALNFLTSFLYAFDWVNLGKKLAAFVNGLVHEIDWYEFGRLLWAGFKIALETLAGFIVGLDMPALANAASQIVIGFFTEMKNTIDRIPWGQIAGQIAAFLASINWAGIFQSVYDAFNAALDALTEFIVGFLDEIGDRMDMHHITDPLIDLVQTVHDFIQTIAEDTRKWIGSVDLEPLSQAFGDLLSAISPLVSTISDGLLWAYENVLLPLASWVIEEAAPASVNALSSAFEAVDAILKVVIGSIKILWDALQPVIEWIKATAISIIKKLGETFQEVAQIFNERGAEIQDVMSGIGEIISTVWAIVEPTLNNFMDLVDVVFTFFKDTILDSTNLAIDRLGGLVDFIAGVFSGDWERAWDGISRYFTSIWDGIWGSFQNIINLILGGVEFLVNSVIAGLNGMINALNRLKFDVPDWVPAIGGKKFGFNIPSISEVQIPRLAQGAVIPPNREFLAVLGDQKSGTNIETPLPTMIQAFKQALRETGMSGGSQTVILEVEGRELGRAVVKFGGAEYQRIGTKLVEAHV